MYSSAPFQNHGLSMSMFVIVLTKHGNPFVIPPASVTNCIGPIMTHLQFCMQQKCPGHPQNHVHN